MSNSKNSFVYIAGAVHSGSSLLDMILNMHPEVVSTGEIFKLSLNPTEMECGCGEPLANCDFWNGVLQEIMERKDISLQEFPEKFRTTATTKMTIPVNEFFHYLGNTGLIQLFKFIPYIKNYLQVTKNNLELFDVVLKHSGKRILIDSTKTAVRMKSLSMFSDQVKIIYLVRDGRSMIPSIRKKENYYGKLKVSEMVEKWKVSNKNIERMLKNVDPSRVFKMRYEDFCVTPEKYLSKICDFLGIDYQNQMLSPTFENFHSIPGNPWLSLRKGEKSLKISKDDKWKRELSDNDLEVFENIGGTYNKSLGYV